MGAAFVESAGVGISSARRKRRTVVEPKNIARADGGWRVHLRRGASGRKKKPESKAMRVP